ncbi:MAG: alpha/beta hydrolase [Gemmatales bacterium]|nr:alpha/beta hydrolase [Gemmatales bacterium]
MTCTRRCCYAITLLTAVAIGWKSNSPGQTVDKKSANQPGRVEVSITTPAKPVRVNPRVYGLVCAEMITKGLLDEPEYVEAIVELGLKIFQYPGGSASYWHHPAGQGGLNARPEEVKKSARGELSRWMAQTSGPDRFAQYIQLVKKSRAEALFIANILHGNPQELDEFLQRLRREQVPVAAVALGQEMHLSPGMVGLGLDEYLRRIRPHIELLQRKYPDVLIAAPATPVGRVPAERQERLREWNRALGKVPGLHGFTQYGWTEFGGQARRLERRPPEEGWPAYREFVVSFPERQLPAYQRDLGKDKKFLMTQWGTHGDQNTPLQGVHLAHMYFFLARYNAAHEDYFAAATLSVPLAGVDGLSGRQPGIRYRNKVTLYAAYLYSKPFRHLFEGRQKLLEATVRSPGEVQALAAVTPEGEILLYLLNPGPRLSLGLVRLDGRPLAGTTRVQIESAYAAAAGLAPVAVFAGPKALQEVVLEPWSLTLLRLPPAVTNRAAALPVEAATDSVASAENQTGQDLARPDSSAPTVNAQAGEFEQEVQVPHKDRLPQRPREPLVRPAGISEKEFVYKKTPQGNLRIIVTFPAGWQATDKRPAVLFFSGGAWANSLINQFKDRAEYFAGRGMVAARADYRAYQSHKTGPDKAVEDARSAMRWLREHADELGIDPHRIAAGGSSAGGHLAACTATPGAPDSATDNLKVSCMPNALLLVNCVADMTGMQDSPRFRERVPGGAEMAKRLSPIHHLGKHTPPTLILDGDQDRWFGLAKKFVEQLDAHGVRAELWIAPGQGHPFSNFSPWREASIVKMDEFLISLGWLQGKPALEVPAGAEFRLYKPKAP